MIVTRKIALCQHFCVTYTRLITIKTDVHFEKAVKVTSKQMKFRIILSLCNV